MALITPDTGEVISASTESFLYLSISSEINAVLESIAPDPSSAGQKKLLVFRVSGDIEAGTNITLSVGQRSAPFDSIVR